VDAARYARISKVRGGGLSENIPIQNDECDEYIVDQDWKLVGGFQDNDISASAYSKKPRPSYNALLEAVRANKVEVIVVTEMSRLYRRVEELLDLIRMAEYTRLRRIVTTDGGGYDLSTGEGVHAAIQAVSTAALESRRISDRMKRKKRAIAKDGGFNGGRRPYGFEGAVRDEQGTLVNKGRVGIALVEPEVRIIHEIKQRILNGEDIRPIVRDLNEREIPSASGGLWNPTAIKYMFGGKRLIGIRTNNGVEYPAKWTAVLTPQELEEIQLILQGKREAHRPGTPQVRGYLLTGLVECGNCGAKMMGSLIVRDSGSQRRYRCFDKDKRGVKTGCGKVYRLAEPVDLLVSDAVLYRLDSADFASVFSGANDGAELQDLLNEYMGQKERWNQVKRAFSGGQMTYEDMMSFKSLIEEAQDDTRAKLQRLQSGRTLAAIPVGQTVGEAWETADIYWRRELISLVVEKITLLPGLPGNTAWMHEPTGKRFRFDPSKVRIAWKL